jgi:hypothetical protein
MDVPPGADAWRPPDRRRSGFSAAGSNTTFAIVGAWNQQLYVENKAAMAVGKTSK